MCGSVLGTFSHVVILDENPTKVVMTYMNHLMDYVCV